MRAVGAAHFALALPSSRSSRHLLARRSPGTHCPSPRDTRRQNHASPEDALAIATAPDAPDVLLLDVRLGDDSGLRVLDSLARRTAVVILTAYDYPEYARAALDAGAAGFVAKGAATAELVATIRRAAAGALAVASRPDQATLRLSAREVDVVRLVTDGLSNDEIGQRLGITTKAVEGHLSRVFARTGARSRTERAVRAVREGWTELPGI